MTWEETARDMARKREDWSDFDVAIADGIESGEKHSSQWPRSVPRSSRR